MKILITGNGFDIAQGLPTAYQDFIKVLNILNDTNENELSESYAFYFKNTTHFDGMTNEPIFNLDNIKNLKANLKNVWFNHFSDQLEIDTWIDFETTLQNTLLQLDNFVEIFKEKIFYQDQNKRLRFDTMNYLGNSSKNVQLLVTFKFITLTKGHSTPSFNINEKYCKFNSKTNTYIDLNEDEFFKFLHSEWNKFIQLFNDYIEIFVNPLISRIKVENKYMVNKHFTFNYTDTYTNILDNRVETRHLHGKISNANSIVLGFNHDGYKRLSKNIIPFTKGFQRISKNANYNFIKSINGSFSNQITVYFLGHSLDISDKKFIDEVFDLIQNKIDRRTGELIILFHSSMEKLLNNLCYMYGIDLIENLVALGKIKFLKSSPEVLRDELKFVKLISNIKFS